MSCPKNIKDHKFLSWKWNSEGEHNMEIVSIGKFMYCSQDFMVTRTCSLCGTTKTSHFTETEELLREGFTIEELNNITDTCSIYPKRKILIAQ